MPFTETIPIDDERNKVMQNPFNLPEASSDQKNKTDELNEKMKSINMRQAEHNSSIEKFTKFTVPYMLFIFGLSLIIAVAFSYWLTGFGPFNIDQTLNAAEKCQNSKELLELSKSVEKLGGNSSLMSSFHLLTKLLIVTVILVEIVACLNMGLNNIKSIQNGKDDADIDSKSLQDDLANVEKPSLEPNVLLMCDYSLRQIQNIRRYSLQCQFTLQVKTDFFLFKLFF